MADTITENNVVQVTLVDSNGNKQSFNIDNPKEDLTLSAIKTALNPAISSGFWYSRNLVPFTAVNSATITESRKIKLSDSDTVIEVTPSSITMSGTSTGVVTVEGATLTGAYLTNFSDTTETDHFYTTINTSDEQKVYVSSTLSSMPAGLTFTLTIVTDARQIQVPVTCK